VTFGAGDDAYRLALPELGGEPRLDHLHRERGELHGELEVSCTLAGGHAVDGVLSIGTFNVSSPRARQDRARLLADRAQTPGINWSTLLEELCQRVLLAERTGEPAVLLHTVPAAAGEAAYRVHGFRLDRGVKKPQGAEGSPSAGSW
jgi:hypothetical protein